MRLSFTKTKVGRKCFIFVTTALLMSREHKTIPPIHGEQGGESKTNSIKFLFYSISIIHKPDPLIHACHGNQAVLELLM